MIYLCIISKSITKALSLGPKRNPAIVNLHYTLTSNGMPRNWPAPSGGVQLYREQGKNNTEVPPMSSEKASALVNLLGSKWGFDITTQARANWSPSIREAFLNFVL